MSNVVVNVVVNIMKRKHKENTQLLCETNYRKLVSMLPDISFLEHVSLNSTDHSVSVAVDVMERTPYTTLIKLSSRYIACSDFSPETIMHVRIYHDANVAEVVNIQGHRRIRSHYAYPNDSMYLPDEKCQSNKLLSEILDFCLDNNYKKSYIPTQIEVNE